MRTRISSRFKAFLSFGALLFVVFVLAAGMKVAFATAPLLSAPDSELTTTHTGYDVGVEIFVNGETSIVDVGDVVAIGAVVATDKAPLWEALDSVAPSLETATLIALVNDVLALPDGYCDFGDLELGADILGADGEDRTEQLRFAANEDCGLEFRGKEVVETTETDSSNDVSSLFGINATHASARTTQTHNDNGCAPDYGYAKETGRTSDRYLSGSDRLLTDSNVRRLEMQVRARLRVSDRNIFRDEFNNPVFDADCTAALTTVYAHFGYSQTGQPELQFDRGSCSRWEHEFLWTAFSHFWSVDVDPVTRRHCSAKNLATDPGTVGIGTVGFYKIDPDNELLEILDALDVPFTKRNTERVRVTAEAYFAPAPLESGRELPQASYSCHVNKLPYVRVTDNTGRTPLSDAMIRRLSGHDIPATSLLIPRNIATYMECVTDYIVIPNNNQRPLSPSQIGPVAPLPPSP